MKSLRLALLILAGLSVINPLRAQVPNLVNYQGRVAVGTTNFNGSGQFKFALVNAAGSASYWSNDNTSTAGSQPTAFVTLTVTKGLYSVLLGDTSLAGMTQAIPASAWANADVRLRVWFNDGTNGFQQLTPDQRLAPNGYLPDAGVSNAKLANSAVTINTGNGLTGGGLVSLGGNITLNANVGTGANQLVALNGSGQLPALNGSLLTSLSGGNLTGPLPAISGANLTSLNAGNITSGTLADARLSANIPLLNAAGNTFTGNLVVGGTNSRIALNTGGYSNVAVTIKGRVGDTSILDLQSTAGSDVFYVDNSGNVSASGLNVNATNGSFTTPFYAPSGTTELGAILTASGANGPQMRFQRGSDGRFFDIGQNGSGGFDIEDADVPRVTIDTSGHVGVGTASPQAGLSVTTAMGTNDYGSLAQGIHLASSIGGYPSNAALVLAGGNNANGTCDLAFATGQSGTWRTISYSRSSNAIYIPQGNFGIGAAPTHGKVDIEGDGGSYHQTGGANNNAYFDATTSGNGLGFVTFDSSTGDYVCSLYASGEIVSNYDFVATSDQRIKHIIGQSNAEKDLTTLLGIEITDYTYIDTIAKGTSPHKKVIAQQVEKVFPEAVKKTTNEVPDIYKNATAKDGWVELATDLKVGERVKLIGEKTEGVYEVIEVRDGAFRTEFKPDAENVFVYGREVKDFRTVDYDAISMLNVSATQELARKLEAKDTEIATLRKQLAENEARDRAIEARLARLEHASGNIPTALKVSLKTAKIKGQ